MVSLAPEAVQQQVQTAGDHEHDDEVAQADFEDPVETKFARALERRREPGPGRDRQRKQQEAQVERAPYFEQVDFTGSAGVKCQPRRAARFGVSISFAAEATVSEFICARFRSVSKAIETTLAFTNKPCFTML